MGGNMEVKSWLVWLAAAVALIAALVNPLALLGISNQVSRIGERVDATHAEVARLRDSEILDLRRQVQELSNQVAVLQDRYARGVR